MDNEYIVSLAAFDALSPSVLEPAREAICESGEDVSESNILAHLIMHWIDDGGVGDNGGKGRIDRHVKTRLVELAADLGPDWVQSLYHAAVFMTKVA